MARWNFVRNVLQRLTGKSPPELGPRGGCQRCCLPALRCCAACPAWPSLPLAPGWRPLGISHPSLHQLTQVLLSLIWSVFLKPNRRELESLTFLFMPQATIHQVRQPSKILTPVKQLSKSSMREAAEEMDRILAKLFMDLPPSKTSKAHGGPLDLVLRGLMLLLSLATGILQSARYLLGMLIMKTIPVRGMSSSSSSSYSHIMKPSCQESGTMGDYHSWLDNIAAADMRASKYFFDKVRHANANVSAGKFFGRVRLPKLFLGKIALDYIAKRISFFSTRLYSL